jgi:peptidoglycan/xylan/chitin deacetylase (PgdA/CDA1 family)
VSGPLILTYHAVEPGPAPLCVHPDLFRSHLDCVVETGMQTLTVSALAEGLRRGTLPPRALAITFDDGAASVARTAAPEMEERGLVGTVFAVAAHLGARNDWAHEPARSPALVLAGPSDLGALAARGWEIGAHGMSHLPLPEVDSEAAASEVAGARAVLEREVGCRVSAFAYPFGLAEGRGVRDLVARHYDAAVTTRAAAVRPRDDPLRMPRVDAHYLRRPALLRHALAGAGGPYLLARRLGTGLRRRVRPDFAGTLVRSSPINPR